MAVGSMGSMVTPSVLRAYEEAREPVVREMSEKVKKNAEGFYKKAS